MKSLITILFLSSSLFLFAQPQVERQKVIVEVGTGTWCPSCPAVVEIIHDLLAEGLDIAVVEYHIGDSYENEGATARHDYYDFPWYPTTYYDSDHIGFDDWATYSVHHSYYEDRINTPSSFSVSIDTEINDNAINGTVQINKIDDYEGSNLKLQIILTESNIPENWQGETELDFTERLMFPNGNGTSVDFSTNNNQSVNFDFTIHPSWVIENTEIVYFLQDNDTKEILQGDFISIGELLSNGNDITQNKKAYFYPNPVSQELFLSAKDLQTVNNIEIYDVLGKKVFSQDVYSSPINVEQLPQGIYLISYFDNEVKYVSKIIKK